MKPGKESPLGCGGSGEGAQGTAQSPNDSTPPQLSRPARRALSRFERRGCHCCGKRAEPGSGYQILAVGLIGRNYRAVCEECAGSLDSVHGYSIFIADSVTDPWMVADREWFAAHPDRSHRIRDAYPGEWDAAPLAPPPGTAPATVVRQTEPGKRRRLPVAWEGEKLPGRTDEAEAHAVFNMMERCYPLGRELTDAERAECYAEADFAGSVQ